MNACVWPAPLSIEQVRSHLLVLIAVLTRINVHAMVAAASVACSLELENVELDCDFAK